MSLQTALASLQGRATVTLEQMQALNPNVHDVHVDGVDVGAVLVIGPEIHACINAGFGRWLMKKQLRILDGVIQRYGYADTATTTQAGEAFVKRLGFKFVGHLNGSKRWRKEK